jgi:hypothetical protein
MKRKFWTADMVQRPMLKKLRKPGTKKCGKKHCGMPVTHLRYFEIVDALGTVTPSTLRLCDIHARVFAVAHPNAEGGAPILNQIS